MTSSQSPEALAIYRRQFDAYAQARQTFEAAATTYWEAVAQKRRQRNAKRRDHQGVSLDDYVLTQPPVYTGPPPPEPPPSEPPPQRSEDAPQPAARPSIPVVADFLESARAYFGFAPRLPRDDLAFKRAYAKAALAAGLTPQQIVRIYAFETGGNGTYDMQAGREYSRDARAVSPALGYNQLLNTNSVRTARRARRSFRGGAHGARRRPDGRCPNTIGAQNRRSAAGDRILPYRAGRLDGP